MKRFRVTFKSKAGGQVVTLMARDRAEAEVLANMHQATRARRYDITHARLDAALGKGMSKEAHAREFERRKLDFSRYDVVTVKPTGETEIGAATAPLTIEKIEEVK